MASSKKLSRYFLLAIVVVGAVYAANRYLTVEEVSTHLVVNVPALSAVAEQGQAAFETNCASCHGANAAGSNQGPPLVHRIYEPNHHGDMAFLLAAKRGVRAHHWQYGNMPKISAVSEQDVALIVRYVRELQKANGIF